MNVRGVGDATPAPEDLLREAAADGVCKNLNAVGPKEPHVEMATVTRRMRGGSWP